MATKRGFPQTGDVVACTVKTISSYAAFATLDEYDGKEGMIHISEISTKWIKNIRDHIKEGRKIVCKVLSVDPSKGHINLSLRRITQVQEKAKHEEVNRARKVEKLIEMLAKERGVALEAAMETVVRPVEARYGELYFALEESVGKGESVFTSVGVPKDWAAALTEVARRNIVPPTVAITATLVLSSDRPSGILDIKKALAEAEVRLNTDETKGDIVVIASPRYRIKVTAPDYKLAESVLKDASDSAISIITKAGGTGEFQRK